MNDCSSLLTTAPLPSNSLSHDVWSYRGGMYRKSCCRRDGEKVPATKVPPGEPSRGGCSLGSQPTVFQVLRKTKHISCGWAIGLQSASGALALASQRAGVTRLGAPQLTWWGLRRLGSSQVTMVVTLNSWPIIGLKGWQAMVDAGVETTGMGVGEVGRLGWATGLGLSGWDGCVD